MRMLLRILLESPRSKSFHGPVLAPDTLIGRDGGVVPVEPELERNQPGKSGIDGEVVF